jgi:hypothetical protein
MAQEGNAGTTPEGEAGDEVRRTSKKGVALASTFETQ